MQTTPQLTPILHTEITFRDAFWKPRIDRNRDVTLPHVLEKCEETGRLATSAPLVARTSATRPRRPVKATASTTRMSTKPSKAQRTFLP